MGEPNPRSRGGKSDTRSMRCPHCAGPLAKEMETSEWTVPPLIRDSFSMDQPLVVRQAHFMASTMRENTTKFHQCIVKEGGEYRFIKYEGAYRARMRITDCNKEVSVMPIVRRWIKGPMWVHFLIGAPPVIVFSSGCAGLAGGSIPALAQLASSSYHAFVSSSPSPPSSS